MVDGCFGCRKSLEQRGGEETGGTAYLQLRWSHTGPKLESYRAAFSRPRAEFVDATPLDCELNKERKKD